MKVLFCDSFYQDPPDGSVYNTWSVIEFPVPVVLEQIRVLPRGVCVHEQLRADGQCGKTSPGQFRIDFFACDEKNDKASTFENLCALEFSEVGNTAAFPRLPFVTTKLLCSGRYSVVTIAVFGAEASDSDAVRQIHRRRQETTVSGQGLLPTPPEAMRKQLDDMHQFSGQPLNPIQPPISVAVNYQQYPGHTNNPNYGFRNNEQGSYQSNRYKRGGGQHRQARPQDSYHGKPPLLPTPTSINKDQPMHHNDAYQYNRFQHQGQDGGWNSDSSFPVEKVEGKNEGFSAKEQDDDDNWDAAEYEEISDEELDEETAANMEAMVAEDMLLPSSMMSFNPFHMEAYPLTYFNAPDMTEFELCRNNFQDQQERDDGKTGNKGNTGSVKLKQLIEESISLCPVKLYTKSEPHEKERITSITAGKENQWVNNLEKMVSLVSKGLPYLEVKSDLDYAFVLSTWALYAVQLDGQIAEVIGLNIRALKVGLSLARELCHSSADIVEHFTTVNLSDSLINILHADHVASSIKIITIHVLDALTNWPMQLHAFMFGDSEVDHSETSNKETLTGYAHLIKLCLKPQTARVSSALNQLVQKIHIYECMREIQSSVQSLVFDKIPNEYAYVSDEGESPEDEEEEDYGNNCEEMEADGASTAEDNDEEDPAMETSLSAQQNIEINIMQNGDKRRVRTSQTSIQLSHENLAEEDLSLEHQVEYNDNYIIAMESVFSYSDLGVVDKDLRKIADCVKEVTSALANPQETIGQFLLKHFPLSKQYATLSDDFNKTKASSTLYRLAEESCLLPSIQALLTLPFVSGHEDVFESCSSLLNQLMSTKSGLIYLLSHSDSVLHICNHLMKSSLALDVETPGTAGYLGAKLSVHLQVLQSLDHIWSLIDSGSSEEDVEEDLVHDLKTLFSLTYPQFSRQYVCAVLGIENFISSIISCLWFPVKLTDPDPVLEKIDEEDKKSANADDKSEDGESEKVEKKAPAIQHRSAINGYAASLLLFMLEISDDPSYIYSHLAQLARSCMTECHVVLKSEEFKKYLSPLEKKLDSSNSDIGKLISLIKDKTSLLEWSSLTIDGPGITTALRLLCHLCIKDTEESPNAESRLRVLELFAVDSLNVLLALGEQLHKTLHYFCHGIRPMAAGLIASTHSLIISMCRCMFLLLRLMLKQVLESSIDNSNIDNVHVTQVLVSLYSDLYVLLRPLDTAQLHSLTGQVVAVLSLFFTNVPSSDKPNPVISELIKYAESQCDNFIPTLLLFSQLLPMPLPIITPDLPPESSRSVVLASCKLWSSIITPHVEKLTSFLLPLSSSISRPVLDVVVILTQQIIDLSPTLALAVVKKYIEDTSPLLVNTVLGNKEEEESETKEETKEEQKELLMMSSEQITAVVTFSEILTLPAAKTAMINTIASEGEGIMDLWTYASHLHTPDEDVAAALLLASVLVDTDLSLVPIDDDLSRFASAFPCATQLKSIIDLAMEKIDCNFAQVSSRVFLVLGLLQNNRFPIPYVRKALRSDRKPLYLGLSKIAECFEASNSHWFDAVYNFIEFVLRLTDARLDSHLGKNELPLSLTLPQLKTLLCWESDINDHPLKVLLGKLNKAFSDNQNFDDDVGYVLNKLSSIIQSLNATGSKEKIPGLDREELPTPMPLTDIFSERPVYVIGYDDVNLYNRLSVIAPLPNTNGSVETEERMVQCDLIATAEKFCPGYDLAEELNKLSKAIDVQHVAEETEAMEKRRQKMETYSARLGKSLTFMKRSHGLLIAQQRTGRGRGRGRGNPSHRPNDLFRHRKQNTSRPPSMHVDDFVAADEEEEQKMGEEETSEPIFKSPIPLLNVQTRHPASNLNSSFKFKSREFTPRGGRGGRISRNTGNYRGRGNFSYQGNNVTPLSKFRPRPSSASSRGQHIQSRYKTNTTTRMSARLSFSPQEGFKTNKAEQGSWRGSARDYSYHNRGGKTSRPPNRGGFTFGQSNNRWGTNTFQRRGRAYNKPRGKHIRSSTR